MLVPKHSFFTIAAHVLINIYKSHIDKPTFAALVEVFFNLAVDAKIHILFIFWERILFFL